VTVTSPAGGGLGDRGVSRPVGTQPTADEHRVAVAEVERGEHVEALLAPRVLLAALEDLLLRTEGAGDLGRAELERGVVDVTGGRRARRGRPAPRHPLGEPGVVVADLAEPVQLPQPSATQVAATVSTSRCPRSARGRRRSERIDRRVPAARCGPVAGARPPTLERATIGRGERYVRTLHHRDGHHGWDRDRPPQVEVEPGTTLELVLADAFGGQLGPDATAPTWPRSTSTSPTR
jgi:hypothetical protein